MWAFFARYQALFDRRGVADLRLNLNQVLQSWLPRGAFLFWLAYLRTSGRAPGGP